MSVLLEKLLEPLARFYDQPDVLEIRMSEPCKLNLVRRDNDNEVVDAPELSIRSITLICKALANYNKKPFDPDDNPSLYATLPPGHRFTCLVGPSVVKGVSMTIRVKHPYEIKLEDMGLCPEAIAYICQALQKQWNIVISGSSFTGKTTLLNCLLKYVPEDRRIISAEDTPEIDMSRFYDGVSLLANRDVEPGPGEQNWSQLFAHKMRSSPDNIIFGEISEQNAKPALSAINSGAKGWMCTIHAESAKYVPVRFEDYIHSAGQTAGDVQKYLRQLVDLVIHIRNTEKRGRHVAELYEMKNDKFVMQDGEFLGGGNVIPFKS